MRISVFIFVIMILAGSDSSSGVLTTYLFSLRNNDILVKYVCECYGTRCYLSDVNCSVFCYRVCSLALFVHIQG